MMENKIGIYKITSPTGAIYIGQSANIVKRWTAYRNGYSKKQPKLHNSFKKHGTAAHVFGIIHELPADIDQQTFNNYEQFYIDAYVDCGCNMMNLRDAGCTGRHSEESKRKMKGKLGKWMTGRKLSKETIAKRSVKQKGLKRSNESKERYRISRIGKNNPMFGKQAWNTGLEGFRKGEISGSRHPMAKVNETQVIEIRSRYDTGEKISILSKSFGLTWGSVYSIVKRKNWKHI